MEINLKHLFFFFCFHYFILSFVFNFICLRFVLFPSKFTVISGNSALYFVSFALKFGRGLQIERSLPGLIAVHTHAVFSCSNAQCRYEEEIRGNKKEIREECGGMGFGKECCSGAFLFM